MGSSLWLLGDLNFLVTLAIGGVTYFFVLALVGGFTQQDMGVVWRAIPLGQLRERLP
jgi:hypothetical protein